VDRPLTLPRHWRRNLDRLVKVTLEDGQTVEGRIVATADSGAALDVSGARHEIDFSQVQKAMVQIEFNRKKKDDD
jgi:ribosome maturation factor RimP